MDLSVPVDQSGYENGCDRCDESCRQADTAELISLLALIQGVERAADQRCKDTEAFR